MDQREEFKRTIVYGETAIGHLKANETAAYPRNYELWYTYSAGYNQALNRTINDILRAAGRLTSDDTDRVYEEFLSPARFGDRIETIGGQLSSELRNVMGCIDTARRDTMSFGQTLEGASNEIARSATNGDALRSVAERLIDETKKMESRAADLENKLLESRRQIDELQVSLATIRSESLTDPLTSLANRKCFDQSLTRALSEAETTGKPFSLIITDIDHFKKFNDTYGHQTGDQVLRLVAAALKQAVKGQDVAARHGGEEFCVILPRTTLDAALQVAEHIRDAVMSKELVKRSTGERLGRITISLGVAGWVPGDTSSSMIGRADAALYRAKNTGRNRVCNEREVTETSEKFVA